VLSFPQTPLHNNPCELDVREKVVQRKIRNCHRSTAGAKASDIFLGLMGTYMRAAQAGMPKKQNQLLGVSKRSSLSNAHHPRTSENNRVLSPSRFPFSHKLLSNYNYRALFSA